MEGKTVIILILLGILAFAYFKPGLYTTYIGKGVNETQSLAQLAMDKINNKPATPEDTQVCGADNVTYPDSQGAINMGVSYVPGMCN